MVERHPELDYVLLLEPYSYGLAGKLAYLVRLVRGMYHLQTARLFVIDNAYLPVHVAPHRAGDHGRPGLARRRRAQAVRRRHRDPARRAGTDVPPPQLRRGRGRRGVDAGAVCGGPPDADRAGARARLATDRLLLRRGGPGRGAGARARRPPGAGRPAGRPLRADVPRPRRREAGGARDGCPATAGGPAGRPRAGPQDPPEPRPGGDRDGRLRRRRRSGRRHQRPAGAGRHPDHRLLVVDRRVRPARPADHPARRRPRRRTRSTPASTSTTGPR